MSYITPCDISASVYADGQTSGERDGAHPYLTYPTVPIPKHGRSGCFDTFSYLFSTASLHDETIFKIHAMHVVRFVPIHLSLSSLLAPPDIRYGTDRHDKQINY